MARITIFGLAGTGTSTVGRMLAEKLGYRFYSTGDMFREMAKEMGFESLAKLHEYIKESQDFDKKFDQRIKELGEREDNIVVESRMAWHFIPHSVKVKLWCDFTARAARLALREQLPPETAQASIIAREQADDARYRNVYGISDINNDEHFDLAIDTTSILPPEIVDRIISFVGVRQAV